MIRIAAANRYAAIAGMVFLAAALLTTISLTKFDPQWIVFLGGVLAAAALAGVSRAVNAQWIIARRTAQLDAARAKLTIEIRLRANAEESLAEAQASAKLIHETLPAMLAYVDLDGCVRYHNRAYARWIGRPSEAIEGRSLEEILGSEACAAVQHHMRDALEGRDVHYESTRTLPGRETCRINAQYLPDFSADGKVLGVFAVLTDVTRPQDVARPATPAPDEEEPCGLRALLISALERDEFTLYWQAIAPTGRRAREVSCHEVLLRMNEEEEMHLPPGAFLPLAEELGLLPELDRWVIRHVLAFAAGKNRKAGAAYFVNLSAPTILDPEFAPFVRDCLKAARVPDHTLCFELPEPDLLANPAAYREFVAALDGTGCRFAVSGVGRTPLSVRLFKELRVDFLKIDSGLVLAMLNGAQGLARVKAINIAAHAAGLRTIAECVESDAARASLESADTDFVQGFGIQRPRPMSAGDSAHTLHVSPERQKATA